MLTTSDKRFVNEQLTRFVQLGGDKEITLKAYQRTAEWANGMTFAEIAEEEGVSKATVAQTVRGVVEKLRVFADNLEANADTAKVGLSDSENTA